MAPSPKNFLSQILGFRFKYRDKEDEKEVKNSLKDPRAVAFTPPTDNEASFTIETAPGGAYGVTVNLDQEVKNQRALIEKYRKMSLQPEIEAALDDICNEAIVQDEEPSVVINTDRCSFGDGVKKKIREEFETVLELFGWKHNDYDIFRRWLVDGILHYHMVIDPKREKDGIRELRYVDSRSLKKVREIRRKPLKDAPGVTCIDSVTEYFLYAELLDEKYRIQNGNWVMTSQGVKLSVDSIASATSGIYNYNRTQVFSVLHKAIKPLNQLRMMEDALVIYRIARAPERRTFYIDTGTMPRQRADQYVQSLMNKYRNKLVYDASTGEIRDDKQHYAMLEDFWLPRREGGKGTEVSTLPGGQNLSAIEDVQFFHEKLVRCFNIPTTRLQADRGFSLGRSNEITRDELKFNKYVIRLRSRFAKIFDDVLRTQLILKRIIKPEDWDTLKDELYYEFKQDNHFTRLKKTEILKDSLEIVQMMDNYVGKYVSREYIRKEILEQDDETYERLTKQMEKEKEKFGDPAAMQQGGFGGGGDGAFGGGGGEQPPAAFGQDPDEGFGQKQSDVDAEAQKQEKENDALDAEQERQAKLEQDRQEKSQRVNA